jgi:hypothetical protein
VHYVFQIYQYEPKVQYRGYITFDDQTTQQQKMNITKMEQRDERRTGVLYVRRYATNTSDHRTDPELLLRAISLLLPYEYEVSDI